MIQRNHCLQQIKDVFEIHSICTILGPRQCGKITLAKQYCRDIKGIHFFDLENPQDLSALNSPFITAA